MITTILSEITALFHWRKIIAVIVSVIAVIISLYFSLANGNSTATLHVFIILIPKKSLA
jgi:hypothetical protein